MILKCKNIFMTCLHLEMLPKQYQKMNFLALPMNFKALFMIWAINILCHLMMNNKMKHSWKLMSFIKVTQILKNSIKFLQLVIVTLILLGYGLMKRQKEKLREVGRHNLNLWIINSSKIISNSQLRVLLIIGGLKNIILICF